MSTDNLTSATPAPKQKIKTPFAKITVQGSVEAPYYSILYFNTEKNELCEGYGSFLLPAVYAWLKDEFEIDEDARAELLVKTRDAAPTANAVEVVHGRWDTIWYCTDSRGNVVKCSVCGYKKFDTTDNYCPNCGAKMDGGNEDG